MEEVVQNAEPEKQVCRQLFDEIEELNLLSNEIFFLLEFS